MKINELAKQLGTTTTTIGNWIKEFEAYFSDGALLKEGRHRIFTENDLRILATIAKFSHEGLNYDAIGERLKAGERVESINAVHFGIDTRMIPAAAVEQMIDATQIKLELEQVKAERDKALDLLEQARTGEKEWQQKYEMLQKQLTELQRELGRLEGKLEVIEKEQDKPKKRRWFGGE